MVIIKTLLQTSGVILLSFLLLACATTGPRAKTPSLSDNAYLEEGKRQFEAGYYKRAMHELLPLACDGNAEAQYAVGYMYYYGFGVTQDTDVGYFWIQRSANKGYAPAVSALEMIDKKKDEAFQARDKLRQ